MILRMYTSVSLRSKLNLKKLLLLNQLALYSNDTGVIFASNKFHKNVLLNSPFHFKTSKTHSQIPTTALILEARVANFRAALPCLLGQPQLTDLSKPFFIKI